MSFSRVFLGGTLSSGARLCFPDWRLFCNRNLLLGYQKTANGEQSIWELSHLGAHLKCVARGFDGITQ